MVVFEFVVGVVRIPSGRTFLRDLFLGENSFSGSVRTRLCCSLDNGSVGVCLANIVCSSFQFDFWPCFCCDVCPLLRSVSCCTGRKGGYCRITSSDQDLWIHCLRPCLSQGPRNLLNVQRQTSSGVVKEKGRHRDGGSQCHSSLPNHNGRLGRVGRHECGLGPGPRCDEGVRTCLLEEEG